MAQPILVRFNNQIVPTNGINSRYDLENPENSLAEKSLFSTQRPLVQQQGRVSPVVQIGKTKIDESQITSLHIWQDEIVPRISLSYLDSNNLFTSGAYPISLPIVTVLVQASNKTFKSQASDFLITNISSSSVPGQKTTLYTLTGELHIPGLNGTVTKAFSNKTSMGALMEIAKSLKLGFADNNCSTKDAMTWIIAQQTWLDAIREISKNAYLDDKTFFHVFIDRWGILNFINVEDRFLPDSTIETGFGAIDQQSISQQMNRVDQVESQEPLEIDIILTNKKGLEKSDLFISDYCMMGNHGEVLMNHAIRQYADSYDYLKNRDHEMSDVTNFISHYHEPLTSTPTGKGEIPQTVEIDEWSKAETIIKRWTGISYGNTHLNYKYSALINEHNHRELSKNLLKVKLSNFNVNIIRGNRVAVSIYSNRVDAMDKNVLKNDKDDLDNPLKKDEPLEAAGNNENQPDAMIEDKFLSGNYYVMAMKHSCVYGKYETELILARRDWQLPRAKNEANT